jgi:protein ImuA
MAMSAVAQETLVALRHQIARIEGTLPERLDALGQDAVVLRGSGRVLADDDRLQTGVPLLDEVLGGGLPKAALTEVHGRQVRDAGAVAGFVLALISLLLKQTAMPEPRILWVSTGGMFAEVGLPYAHGLRRFFGISPQMLLLAEVPKPVDSLWVAQEAAALKSLAAVIIEVPGNPQQLDLTATRRLHRRATDAGRPVFLLRQSAEAAPTAAPLRFIVTPAPAGERRILGSPLAGSIGPPAFTVALDKNRLSPSTDFQLEWNADDRVFKQRSASGARPQDPVALVPLSQHGTDMAAATGARVAFGGLRFRTPSRQLPGQ